MNRPDHHKRAAAKKGESPLSNKRQRNNPPCGGGDNPQFQVLRNRTSAAAVEVSNSSISSSVSTSSASRAAVPVALEHTRQVSQEQEQSQAGGVLEQLLGRREQKMPSHTSPNVTTNGGMYNSFASNLMDQRIGASQQQQSFGLNSLQFQQPQPQNAQISDLLSGQILFQRQRQMQLQQQQANYYMMFQQSQLGEMAGGLAGAGQLGAGLNTGLRRGGGNMIGSSHAGLDANNRWNLLSSQTAQQQQVQSQSENQLLLQRLQQQLAMQQQQQSLSSQLGASGTTGGAPMDVSRLVDNLLAEQRILAAHSPTTAGALAYSPMSQQQAVTRPLMIMQNQVPSSNPLASLMEASARLSRLQGQPELAQGGAMTRNFQRNDSESSLAMPSSDPESIKRTSIMTKDMLSQHKLVPMSIPADLVALSEYQCLVREQIVFFAATDEHTGSSVQGRNRPIVLGQVGIHCIHCWREQHYDVGQPSRFVRQKPRGASYFPSKLAGIYQAAQNMCSNHFMDSCRSLPLDIRAKLVAPRDFKAGETKYMCPEFHPTSAIKRGWATSNAGGGKQYWANAAQNLGVMETEEHGLVFKDISSESGQVAGGVTDKQEE